MKLHSLSDLFQHELQDLYDAEYRIARSLEKSAKKLTNEKLKKATQDHLEETETQIERLEKIFESTGIAAKRKVCKGIQGILEEADEILAADTTPEALDAAMIAGMQRVEHYEIAAYGCAIVYAKMLGEKDAEKLLKKTLDEEEKTDKKLSKLAEQGVNEKALYADRAAVAM
ncbi:ferritin-like domain-containing protein [Candidatus Woesebacteria bacterium]|nr:ferritin-like domain-containing protein [Candidatus Woesebacteria bacterium]